MATNRDPYRPVSLYFNLTNACNSACIFCVSNSQNISARRDIPSQAVIEAYERFQVGSKDEVVLNGGEPTIYSGLHDLIRKASGRGAKVFLSTNGRLLQQYGFAHNLLEAGVFRLSIPLHGRFPETHDELTCRPGSLRETVTGIHNAFLIRGATGYPAQIELKLLAVRAALPEWPAIVDFIDREFDCPDELVLSGLNMWSTANSNYNRVTPTIDDMRCYVNEALDRAVAYEMPVVLWSIPLCVLNQEHLTQFGLCVCRTTSGLCDGIQTMYFDPENPEGIELPNNEPSEWFETNTICRDCELFEVCGPGSAFMYQVLAASR